MEKNNQTPYMKKIMDVLGNGTPEWITIKKGPAMGRTSCLSDIIKPEEIIIKKSMAIGLTYL